MAHRANHSTWLKCCSCMRLLEPRGVHRLAVAVLVGACRRAVAVPAPQPAVVVRAGCAPRGLAGAGGSIVPLAALVVVRRDVAVLHGGERAIQGWAGRFRFTRVLAACCYAKGKWFTHHGCAKSAIPYMQDMTLSPIPGEGWSRDTHLQVGVEDGVATGVAEHAALAVLVAPQPGNDKRQE